MASKKGSDPYKGREKSEPKAFEKAEKKAAPKARGKKK